MKVGLDLLRISRMRRLMKDQEALKKLFSPAEISDNAETLAGIFAAKEAFFKAVGQKGDWLSVEVIKDRRGKPFISYEGRTIAVSITHEGEYAAAVVFIKGDEDVY